MIELKKCECGAQPDIEFDLGDLITLCASCHKLRRYPGLGARLRAAMKNESGGADELRALLGVLADDSGNNTHGKGKKNEENTISGMQQLRAPLVV